MKNIINILLLMLLSMVGMHAQQWECVTNNTIDTGLGDNCPDGNLRCGMSAAANILAFHQVSKPAGGSAHAAAKIIFDDIVKLNKQYCGAGWTDYYLNQYLGSIGPVSWVVEVFGSKMPVPIKQKTIDQISKYVDQKNAIGISIDNGESGHALTLWCDSSKIGQLGGGVKMSDSDPFIKGDLQKYLYQSKDFYTSTGKLYGLGINYTLHHFIKYLCVLRKTPKPVTNARILHEYTRVGQANFDEENISVSSEIGDIKIPLRDSIDSLTTGWKRIEPHKYELISVDANYLKEKYVIPESGTIVSFIDLADADSINTNNSKIELKYLIRRRSDKDLASLGGYASGGVLYCDLHLLMNGVDVYKTYGLSFRANEAIEDSTIEIDLKDNIQIVGLKIGYKYGFDYLEYEPNGLVDEIGYDSTKLNSRVLQFSLKGLDMFLPDPDR